MGDEELWYEQRFLLCYIVAVFLHWGYKLQVQDGSGYNNYSPLTKGVLLVIFYKKKTSCIFMTPVDGRVRSDLKAYFENILSEDSFPAEGNLDP